MPTISPKIRLLIQPVLIHALAGAITLGYNFLCRQMMNATSVNDSQLKLAAIGYVMAASGLSGYLNRRLILAAKTPASILMIPYWRALTNTLTWLCSIPVLTGVAFLLNGKINLPNFYNFCISIVIGWVVATTYSTLFYLDRISQDFAVSPDSRKLLRLNSSLLFLAAVVPFLAATSVLVLIRPETVATDIGVVFNGFLFLLYIMSAYGVLYVSKKTKKIRQILCHESVEVGNHSGL